METPEQEWDGEALDVVRDHGRSIGNARDLVILDWLTKGDTRPLSDWLMRGHAPGEEVMKALAVMLIRGHPDANQKWFKNPGMTDIAEIFTLRLEVAGKGKRRGDAALRVRDKRIALEVAKAKQTMTEIVAFDTVAAWLVDIGHPMTSENVQKIYKAQKHLIYGTNSAPSVP